MENGLSLSLLESYDEHINPWVNGKSGIENRRVQELVLCIDPNRSNDDQNLFHFSKSKRLRTQATPLAEVASLPYQKMCFPLSWLRTS